MTGEQYVGIYLIVAIVLSIWAALAWAAYILDKLKEEGRGAGQ